MTDELAELAPFGSDRIESREGRVMLVCPRAKGWNPRRPGSQTRAAHPGTAVSWGNRLFEVVGEVVRADGSVAYHLEAWPEAQTIRTLERYDAASEAQRSARRSEEKRDGRRLGAAFLLAPLAGFLPGELQRRMENDFGAPARAMTITSALIELAVGVVGYVFALAEAFGGGMSRAGGGFGLPRLPLALCVFLIAEAAIRLGSAFLTERPMGTIASELPWAILRRLREGPGDATPAPEETRRRDRYRVLEAFLALLTEAEQFRLRREFGFDPILWGRRTAGLLLLLGGGNAAVAVLNAAAGVGNAADWLWFLAGAALAVEQIARLRRLSRDRPAGSVLGALVRPLARPLFAPRLPASPS